VVADYYGDEPEINEDNNIQSKIIIVHSDMLAIIAITIISSIILSAIPLLSFYSMKKRRAFVERKYER